MLNCKGQARAAQAHGSTKNQSDRHLGRPTTFLSDQGQRHGTRRTESGESVAQGSERTRHQDEDEQTHK